MCNIASLSEPALSDCRPTVTVLFKTVTVHSRLRAAFSQDGVAQRPK